MKSIQKYAAKGSSLVDVCAVLLVNHFGTGYLWADEFGLMDSHSSHIGTSLFFIRCFRRDSGLSDVHTRG